VWMKRATREYAKSACTPRRKRFATRRFEETSKGYIRKPRGPGVQTNRTQRVVKSGERDNRDEENEQHPEDNTKTVVSWGVGSGLWHQVRGHAQL